ncbi:hypothetical protein F6X40_36325 [Paraburkholderia sp. UCT31]|uniref:hypothetical protein n=1 Tax=Paraburkholderia sp. UCT31 TaxID=2615209 RepID=UPI0016565ED6|nr:hypothetical protein [Paraburkholderia sp. UCT31]MBC8742008.1 hypothetical protein [Paraburkholderia sp. UCT31]
MLAQLKTKIAVAVALSALSAVSFAARSPDSTSAMPASADPLLLDLTPDHSGIKTTPPSDKVLFDHEGSGFAAPYAWAAPNIGILAYDPDGLLEAHARQGLRPVDNGTQLFGDATKFDDGYKPNSSFDALMHLAGPDTVTLDPSHPVWKKVKVWVDSTDKDGALARGRLLSLDEAGIAKILLTPQTVTNGTDANGNKRKRESTFIMKNGEARTIGEYSLVAKLADTEDLNLLPLSPEVMALPDIEGSGTVHDLRQAMARDPKLVSLVKRAAAAASLPELAGLGVAILGEWTRDDGASGEPAISPRHVVEKFSGFPFSKDVLDDFAAQHPGVSVDRLIAQAYGEILRKTVFTLAVQTSLANLWPQPFDVSGETAPTPKFDDAGAEFDRLLATDPAKALQRLTLFAATMTALGVPHDAAYTAFAQHIGATSAEGRRILEQFSPQRKDKAPAKP